LIDLPGLLLRLCFSGSKDPIGFDRYGDFANSGAILYFFPFLEELDERLSGTLNDMTMKSRPVSGHLFGTLFYQTFGGKNV
jgi:hypothetical protein